MKTDSYDTFNSLFKELDDLYHEIALKLGISDSAFTILYVLCKQGNGCLQRDICQQSYCSKQTINSSIRRLVQEGYLYLTPGQGRDKHIHLTDAGTVFIDTKIRPIIEMEDLAFSSFSSRERKEFLRLLKKFVDTFRDEEKEFFREPGNFQ